MRAARSGRFAFGALAQEGDLLTARFLVDRKPPFEERRREGQLGPESRIFSKPAVKSACGQSFPSW